MLYLADSFSPLKGLIPFCDSVNSLLLGPDFCSRAEVRVCQSPESRSIFAAISPPFSHERSRQRQLVPLAGGMEPTEGAGLPSRCHMYFFWQAGRSVLALFAGWRCGIGWGLLS